MKQPETSTAKPDGSPALAEAPCSVKLCNCTAICEVAIEGEWFPLCEAPATNRLAPRRQLSPNVRVSDRQTNQRHEN